MLPIKTNSANLLWLSLFVDPPEVPMFLHDVIHHPMTIQRSNSYELINQQSKMVTMLNIIMIKNLFG
jgi:hypothetical protein